MTAFIVRRARPNPVLQELDRLQAEAARKEKSAKKSAAPEAEPAAAKAPAKKSKRTKGTKA